MHLISTIVEYGEEAVDCNLQEHGYLFLASSEKARDVLLSNHATQCAAGADWMQLLERCRD